VTYSNLANDRQFSKTKMPPETLEVVSNGCIGFSYDITCELGNAYKLFAYFNGSRYRVLVVEPTVERSMGWKLWEMHDSHVLPDGSICLEPTMQGCRTLEQAFAKSVLWANGYSIWVQTGEFPYSANNRRRR
jgi:hypothetical protein